MKSHFGHSETQAFVEHSISTAGVKNTLYVNIESKNEITLIIEEDNDGTITDKSNIELSIPINSEDFQKVVDWLREEQIIK